jgi:hypothetical protein
MKGTLFLALGLVATLCLSVGFAAAADDAVQQLQAPWIFSQSEPAQDMFVSYGDPSTGGQKTAEAKAPAAVKPKDEKPVEKPKVEDTEEILDSLSSRQCTQPNCSAACDGQGGGDPAWSLPQPCILQNLGIKMGGWIEQGITFNSLGRDQGFNGPVGTNDFNGEYQLNQLWLYLDKPIKNDGCGWDLGGHVDAIYGTDWRFGINHGLEDRINSFDRQSYGVVLPQFYMDVAYNDLTIRMGHMDDLLGYEVVPAVMNPLYSHSYAMAFGEPVLVTGAIAMYNLTERLTVWGGFTRGWMQFEDNNDTLDLVGGIKWKSRNKRTEIDWGVEQGPQDVAGVQDRVDSVFVLKQMIGKKWQYIFQNNYGIQRNSTLGNVALGDAAFYDIDQYFLYTINPCWKAVCRVEWFRDDDGIRVFGPPPQAGIRAWPEGPGFAGNFYEVTLGLNWRPHSNILFRPEARWDWYQGSTDVNGLLPFGAGDKDNQFLFGVDMIVTY